MTVIFSLPIDCNNDKLTNNLLISMEILLNTQGNLEKQVLSLATREKMAWYTLIFSDL